MKRVFVFLLVFLASVTTLPAQASYVDIASVAKPIDDPSDVARIWNLIDSHRATKKLAGGSVAALDLGDFDYPQAEGVIQVIREPNQSRSQRVLFISTEPMRGIVTAKATLPNGDSWGYGIFDMDHCCSAPPPFMVYMNLWDGMFPGSLNGWNVQFDFFNVVGGKVSRVTAHVSFSGASLAYYGPQLEGPISETFTNGSFQVTAPGKFQKSRVDVVVGWMPVKGNVEEIPFGPQRQLRVGLPINSGLPEGDTPITICQDGACQTRIFYHNSPSSTQPPLPKGE